MTRSRRIEIPNKTLLRRYLEEEKDPTVRLRLTVLNLIAELPRSLSLAQICVMVDVPEPTAYVWVRAWRDREHPTESGGEPGRPPALDDDDLNALKALLEDRPFWQTREVRTLIREHFGVTLSESQVSRILRDKLGMHFGKPYPYDAKRPSDAEAQLEQRLIDAYERLRAQGLSDTEIALGFLDEASPQLTANTARVWHFGHGEITKNTARLKANAIGFYALIGTSLQDFLPRSNQTAIAAFFDAIKAANADYQAIIAILDHFSSHHAAEVKQAAKEHAIELVFLPPYAPDLNPIEFIWKSVKRVISVNFIGSLDELKHHIRVTFNEASQYCSYARSWIERFVPHVLDYKEFCG
ncbi:IS630 family transposase [Halochromatium glycolicum]|nr:IS630 family transposase [Halochromatium glycolicum]